MNKMTRLRNTALASVLSVSAFAITAGSANAETCLTGINVTKNAVLESIDFGVNEALTNVVLNTTETPVVDSVTQTKNSAVNVNIPFVGNITLIPANLVVTNVSSTTTSVLDTADLTLTGEDFFNSATPVFTDVVEDVTGDDSGASSAGTNSFACGQNAEADGDNTTASGAQAKAIGTDNTAVGAQAEATDGTDATAIGSQAKAKATGATAVGSKAEAEGELATAIGFESTATGGRSTAVGSQSLAIGDRSSAFGNEANAEGIRSVAVGDRSDAFGGRSIAIGTEAQSRGFGSIAMGQNADTGADYATAIGSSTNAEASGSVALGTDSTGQGAFAGREDEIVLGTDRHTYTARGITSDRSLARQSGPLELVTTDEEGHLASDGGQIFETLGEHGAGIAIATAMENPDLVGSETFGLAANVGFFEGNTALALSAMGVLGHNFMGGNERWAVSGGFGVSLNEKDYGGHTTDRTVAGRAGVQISW